MVPCRLDCGRHTRMLNGGPSPEWLCDSCSDGLAKNPNFQPERVVSRQGRVGQQKQSKG